MKGKKIKLIYRSLKRERFFQIALFTLGVISASSLGIFFFESDSGSSIMSLWDGVWWAFVTICTVGYGDKFPVTDGGKVIGILLMISGVGLLSMLTATVAAVLVEHKLREGKGLEGVKEKGHILICGWNDHTENVITGVLRSDGDAAIILINSLKPDKVDLLRLKYEGQNIHFLQGDYINEETLLKSNVRKARAVIIMADFAGPEFRDRADNRTILAALAVKSLAPEVRTVAELLDHENVYHLRRAKVDEIVVRGESAGALIAGAVDNPGLPGILSEMVTGPEGTRMKKKKIPPDFVGRRFSEYCEYEKRVNGAIVIGLSQEKKTIRIEDILTDNTSMIDNFIREKVRESEKGAMEAEQPGKIMLNPGDDQVLTAENFAILIK